MKLKKYLLGLLLFVWVWLTSFSSAWEYHLIWSDYSSSQNSSYNVWVISNWNLKTSYLWQDKSIFFLDWWENSHFFYWTTSNEPYIFSSLSWGMPYRNVKEWIPPSFFVCDEITSSSSITDWPWNCGYSQSLDSVDLSSFFNSLIVGVDYYWYNIVSNVGALRQQDFFICFSSSFLWQSICFNTIWFNGDSYYVYDLTWSLDYWSLWADLWFWSILDSNVWFSPAWWWGWSSSWWISDVVIIHQDVLTNSWVVSAFEQRWYYKGLCYSNNFYTWNLITSGTTLWDLFISDLEDSTYYWSSVYDFYKSEWSSLSMFSWAQQRYSLMKYTYEKNNLSPYVWFEKGTWNLFFNIYNSDFNTNFNFTDYFSYCDLVVNWYSWGSLFTWYITDSMNHYIERLKNEQNFILSGANNNFSWDVSFLNLFNQWYSKFKDWFWDYSDSWNWILPWYIVIGFMLMLLYYSFKK